MNSFDGLVARMGKQQQVAFEESLHRPVMRMMLRGVRTDRERKQRLGRELEAAILHRQQTIEYICGHPLNVRANNRNGQMQKFFYEDMAIAPVINRKTGNPTLDDDALGKIAERERILAPVVKLIREERSLGVFKSTFVDAKDTGGRMRCSYNIAGTATFRFSSSEDAFGSGCNLQNIPNPANYEKEDAGLFPDIRKIFIPDDGYTIMDWDLDRADLQVVVWEADDKELKQALREKVDLHAVNANTIQSSRQTAKVFVHGTNYGGKAATMARHCGLTTHHAEMMQRRWFSAHPGILDWHRRTAASLESTHSVSNAFGFTCQFFDRIDSCLPEALGWIPQSTVAIVINTGLQRVDNLYYPSIIPLMQVHDSLVLETLTPNMSIAVPQIREALTVVIPYPDPLIIPISGKASPLSWGDCEKI